jgi:hypothetical protein
MEDKYKSGGRRLQRCYQCNRFEEELWALAYGEVWPLIRKALTAKRSPDNDDQQRTSSLPKLKIGA